MYCLSTDVQRYLISYLSCLDIIRLGATCKRFYSLSKDELVWKNLLVRDYPLYRSNKIPNYCLMYKFLISVKSFRSFTGMNSSLISEFSEDSIFTRSIAFLHPIPGVLVEPIEEDYFLAPDMIIIRGYHCFVLLQNKRLPYLSTKIVTLDQEDVLYLEQIPLVYSCKKEIYRSSWHAIQDLDVMVKLIIEAGYLYLEDRNNTLICIAGANVRTHSDLFCEVQVSSM